MEYLIVIFRLLTVMALSLFLTLKTGRRNIGELPVFDFIAIIVLGSVIGADIADPEIKHLPTIMAVIVLFLLQYLYSYIIIKNRKIGKTLTFDPFVVIEKGQLVHGNLLKLKYSIDNILMMLREKDVFDISEVEFAVLEQTGRLSVLKKSTYQPATLQDLKLKADYKGLSIPVIMDGTLLEDNVKRLNIDIKWLVNKLNENDIESYDQVFFASINSQNKLYVSKYLDSVQDDHKLNN